MLTVTHNLTQFKAQLASVGKQERYAMAVALTRTAQAVRDETPARLDRTLDRPTPFTKRGVYVQRATAQKLEAVVGFMDAQAAYLRYQEEGGRRAPARRVIVLPSRIKLDAYGSIPRAEFMRLYLRAKSDKRATRALSRRLGISSKVDLFIGDPGEGRPSGIWQRVAAGHLVPIVVFREAAVRYKPRLGWVDWGLKQARARIATEYRRALQAALATAR